MGSGIQGQSKPCLLLHKGQVISCKGESTCKVDPKEEGEEEEQEEEEEGGGRRDLPEETKESFMK